MEGLPRHLSVHAAGVVISKLPLDEIVPLQLSNGVLVTQFDKDKVEELGLLKMDFLGLRTLTIVAETLANIKKSRGIELELSKIPQHDAKTAKMLSAGETAAVFQMESPGMTQLVKDLRPKGFEDLIPTVALYRPGPLGSGMVADFIAGKRGRKVKNYLHPKLEPILRETFGVILYQEQVMQIVQTLAGFTLGQADILRRAMSKKKAEILLAQKENFLRGCESNGVEKSLAEKIFELLSHFADYGFNKSHSAAYGLLAWQTAYLKAHYPAEYMSAMMSGVQDASKITTYIEIARRMKIKVLSPDINLSAAHFMIDKGAIRFGLFAIKSVGEVATTNILHEREEGGAFKSLTDFCGRIDSKSLTRRSLQNLIKCGAFDGLGKSRAALLEYLDTARENGYKIRTERKSGAINLFGEEELPTLVEKIPDVEEAPKAEILAWEKETLGFYLSGHPLDEFRDKLSNLTPIAAIMDEKFLNKRVKVGGIITEARRINTKRGDTMAYLKVEDFDGVIDVTIFPNVFAQCFNFVAPSDIVVVEGRVDDSGDTIQLLAERISRLQDYSPDFWLTIPARLENATTLDKLRKIFAKHAGNSRIFLNRNGVWKKIAQKISDGSDLRDELKLLLGAENFRLY